MTREDFQNFATRAAREWSVRRDAADARASDETVFATVRDIVTDAEHRKPDWFARFDYDREGLVALVAGYLLARERR